MAINLTAKAGAMRHAWRSEVLSKIGGANIKVLRMDAQPFDEEVHDYDEAVLVLGGRFLLGLEGRTIELTRGDYFVIAAGVRHHGAPGSHGTLMIFDV
jgi:quercetin dioxygenase-like cupin family protein